MTESSIGSDHVSFYNDIVNAAESQSDYKENTFFESMCDEIVEVGEIPSFERAHYEGLGIRVDGFSWNDLDDFANLTVMAVDFSQDSVLKTLTQSDLDTAFKRLKKFVVVSRTKKFLAAQEVTSPHFGLASLINESWERINKIRMILLTNKVLSSRIDELPDTDIEGKPITRSVWDFGRLHSVRSSAVGREDIEIDLVRDFGGPVDVLRAHTEDSPYEAYLAVFPGAQLASIYERYADRLLEQNVRVFLQAKGGVNRGIRKTLQEDPSMFFAYNNGVTATAEEIVVTTSSEGLKAVALKNLQIVNGGQTTASIFEASRQGQVDLSKVFVQVKLSVIDTTRVQEIVPRISEYANTQNRVTSADFFSNHPFHVRFEECSRRIWAPPKSGSPRGSKWFYERARGQYGVSRTRGTPASSRQFELEFPKDQVVNKTDLAKYLMAWRGRPHVVSQGAQKNFKAFAEQIEKEWESNPNSFNDLLFQESIAKTILFRTTERIVSKATWYQGGYRANIVAYAISKFAYELKESLRDLDFEQIWRDQRISGVVEVSLDHCAELAQEIILHPGSSHRNIGEWAKQERCWQSLRSSKVELPKELAKSLVDVSEARDRKRDGEFLRQLDNGIASQTQVVNIGKEFWEKVYRWGKDRGLLTAKEEDIISICKQIPRKVPTDRQSGVACEAVKRLVEEGFLEGEKLFSTS